MQLTSIEFTEFGGTAQEWSIEGWTLGAKNLVVGKNASGKSRATNIIWYLAKLLAGLDNVRSSWKYDVHFAHEDLTYQYLVEVEDGIVVSEKLNIDSNPYLERGNGGVGTITAEKEGKPLDFQAPTNLLAVVARRDSIQHKFLEPLYSWASSVRHYPFSSYLGKEHFAIIANNGIEVSDSDSNAVIGLYRSGYKQFGDLFKREVIQDLARIDYDIDDLDIMRPISLNVHNAPGEIVGLFVKEKSLPGITDQSSMSVGMFRVLSLVIQLNLCKLRGVAGTVIIDDIGEGLDFSRSCKLINLLREKAERYNVQLIMTTNDRFVMNEVPLDEWSVLVRKSNKVTVKNIHNSKEVFEEFKFTGLSNFSFFELDVANAL